MTFKHKVLDLLSLLRAIQWNAWVGHWSSAGPSYYADHRLFERIYTGQVGEDEDSGAPIVDQIDSMGEKIAAHFGARSLDSAAIEYGAAEILRKAQERHGRDFFAAALDLEKLFQTRIARAVKGLSSSEIVWDNFLRTLADERSEVVYLLQQRMGGTLALGDVLVLDNSGEMVSARSGRWTEWAKLGAIAALLGLAWWAKQERLPELPWMQEGRG